MKLKHVSPKEGTKIIEGRENSLVEVLVETGRTSAGRKEGREKEREGDNQAPRVVGVQV